MVKYIILNTDDLANIAPPIALPNTIPKLNVLDCNDVATSFPVSTCLVTAVWNIVTRAPKEIPHNKNVIFPLP